MIRGTITVGKQTFNWMESGSGSSGPSNRAIFLNPGKHMYWFSPNPHDNPKYNKKQEEFYSTAASFIEEKANWASDNWPADLTGTVGQKVTFFGVEYTLKKE